MDKYIKYWIDIIEGMNNSNTYKLAWGKAILECVENDEHTLIGSNVILNHNDIVVKMMKYYWNQTFFFNLNQGPNLTDKPVMYQLTNELINYYIKQSRNNKPVWFNEGKKVLANDKKMHESYIKKFVTIANQNVTHRFLKLGGQVVPIYVLDKKNKTITFKKEDVNVLKEFSGVLKLLFNYKWAQLLEMYNRSPKIASKVENSSNAKIKRKNLSKFKKILLEYMEEGDIIDFYTGDVLEENDISIDHVIPWSFMYSDDLWNLVVTSKSNNSSKSNKVTDEKFIEKLKERNTVLYHKMIDDNKKEGFILKEAMTENFVDRYYSDFKIM